MRRLNLVALRRIGGRFEELDAQTGEVMAALRNLESQRTFIRSNRDWLYRTLRAWQPLLLEWDGLGFTFDEACGRRWNMPIVSWRRASCR